MNRVNTQRPPVPGGPAIPDYGSSRGDGRAGGAKNLRATVSYHHKQLYLTTYNTRTLRLDESLAEIEVELEKIKWHILGMSEIRREGEDTLTLESGHLLYYREGDQTSQGGVGFLINKVLVNNIVEISSVSTRVAYVILRLNQRYLLKVVQVYAPTSAHTDEEVETLYEDISRAINNTTKSYFTVVMGDFNAKVGVQELDEVKVGPHGVGIRNRRGQMLVNFLERQGLFLMNTFFQKKAHRKWTWQSPDNKTRNEIDFIMCNHKDIFRDVSVISRFNTGSDHRLVRGSLSIDFQLQRRRMMKSTLRPKLNQPILTSGRFQLELRNQFDLLETTDDIDQEYGDLVNTIREIGGKYLAKQSKSSSSKISSETLDLMKQRREMHSDLPDRHSLNKLIKKRIRYDMRSASTRNIQIAIECTKGSIVFAKTLGRSPLTKLRT